MYERNTNLTNKRIDETFKIVKKQKQIDESRYNRHADRLSFVRKRFAVISDDHLFIAKNECCQTYRELVRKFMHTSSICVIPNIVNFN